MKQEELKKESLKWRERLKKSRERDMNRIIYLFLNNKRKAVLLFVILTMVFGFLGYYFSPKVNGFEVFNKTVSLFAFDWIEENNVFLIAAQFFAIVSVFLTVVVLFLRDTLNDRLVWAFQKSPFTLVAGLGKQNAGFLKSLPKNSPVIAIEEDKNNPLIDRFRERNVGVIVKKAQEAITELDLTNLRNAVISTGNSSQNISIATILAERYEGKEPAKIFLRIENRNLSVLFRQNVVKNYDKVDIVVYSIYENMAKALFDKHSILGERRDIIETDEEFSVVLVGSSPLCAEILYHIAVLSNLPNQNVLNLYLADKDAEEFYKKIKRLFWNIEKVEHLRIKPVKVDSDSFEFYKNDMWRSKNLTNIIIATENDDKNLDIAINLQDIVFLRDISEGKFKTKVLVATDMDKTLARKINEDKEFFKNFYTFGDKEEASSKENLIDEELDLIAKAIHYLYKKIVYDSDFLITDKNREEVEKRWYDIEMFSDKLSNKMQALHMDTKLLALGLRKVRSYEDKRKLLEKNREIFLRKLGKTDVEEKEIYEFSKKLEEFYDGKILDTERIPKDFKPLFLPKKYDTLFEKLIRSEHNRWMTYHYLNGWEYGVSKNKRAKKHNGLVPFDDLTYTVIFDIYSVLYIPNILASAGYELKEIESLYNFKMSFSKDRVIFGITGHRDLCKRDLDYLKREIKKIFEKYLKIYPGKKPVLLSPLAEGADMLAAEAALEEGMELWVEIPFEERAYLETFECKRSIKKYEDLKRYAKSFEISNCDYAKEGNGCFRKLGKKMADRSDILIALWDGKDNGKEGGTADIVNYAKSLKKTVCVVKTLRSSFL